MGAAAQILSQSPVALHLVISLSRAAYEGKKARTPPGTTEAADRRHAATPSWNANDAAALMVAVSGTKSMTGHLLGGAGAVESVAAVLALHHRMAPVTANLENLDDDVALDIVHGAPRPLRDGDIAALNNSFGFGGHNVAVVFRSV